MPLKIGTMIPNLVSGSFPDADHRELLGSCNARAFGRSRPAADATREVVEGWLLDDLM